MEWYGDIFRYFTNLQQQFNSIISSHFRELENEMNLWAIFVILSISFIYGIIHALGPGHGKALVASYFLSNKKRYREAFKIGYLISAIHAVSALSITLIIYYVLETVLSRTFAQTSEYMMKFSGALIVLVGIYLFFEHYKKQKVKSEKSIYALAFFAGIVPCPGVMMVVLFSISMGKLYIGIIAAILMSLGMGFTISLSAIMATFAKNKAPSIIATYIPYIGNSFIILLGLYLLLS